ncbi:MAG: hypothetical protein K6G25_05090 [Bacteroidales bacterium]|nr:hypothetical protein [Bacteroidales bacterium]
MIDYGLWLITMAASTLGVGAAMVIFVVFIAQKLGIFVAEIKKAVNLQRKSSETVISEMVVSDD